MAGVGLVRLLLSSDDRPGIVARVSGFLFAHGANIVDLQQHSTDPEGGQFFMRVVFDARHLDLDARALKARFAEEVAAPLGGRFRFAWAARKKPAAILVSRADHALLELLWRWRRGALPMDLKLVIGNHAELKGAVEAFGLPFYHVPVERGKKAEAELQMLELLGEAGVELVILARYMQILSPAFVDRYPNRIINIHHSFLPAFAGARPYHQAYARGVKLIGATAHYVTAELDAGPIIAQDVVRVSHRDGVRDLMEKGRDLEKRVLAEAVAAHLEDRVLVYENKTIVFD